jgi:signal transduction histidine kinase
VVTNLLINASIHGYRERSPEIITVKVECSEDQAIITVSDKGRGMTEETRSRIFEPFFTTNKEKGGSGLGLMVVYNLVNEKLKGSIDCKTAPGKGTDFIVRLPLRVDPASDDSSH